ncbi:uncharacterized protein ARMOST_04668 [Armillaria ostoyae]|uniref:Reverse transcriptase domain-containing protein n=1 Tax=Armillaria ostoyae TaxID=47428 RepID=A0A284QY06_ARMOS|nr:uncharacterized protein ARMOST_04668 [Armillaria ostoyae]
MTSNPVLKSQNQYTTLSIKGNDNNNNNNDLCSRDDGRDTGDTAAAMRRPSRWESGGEDPALQGTTRALKSKQPSPPSLGPVWVTLKGLSQSSARAQAKVAKPTGHGAESPIQDDMKFPTRAIPGPKMGIKSGPPTSEGTGRTDKSVHSAQVQPDTLPASGPLTRSATHSSISIQKQLDEDDEEATNATVTKTATGKGAASIQAVNRGHSVTMMEVPNEEDDMAYLLWFTKKNQKEVTSNKPAWSSVMVPVLTRGWCRPFEVDWTLCAVCEARNDNAACAVLFVWTHKDQLTGLTNELLSELQKGGELAWEQLYELHKPPHCLCRRQSSDRDFTLDIQLSPCTGTQTLVVKGLLHSGCTSSSINRAFVQKHRLDMRKTAVPITVYNANSTCNKAGNITEFVEFQMTIGNHSERINFAVTNLGTKDLYLGHDWLKCHNPVINWKMGTILFRHCQCIKNLFPLPDTDPDDQWDEELEEGKTILAVNMEEELVIRAVHHANDLATATNADKPKKTFEEMVPPDYRSFHDLFSKENFDELPKRKPWDHAIELIPNAKLTLDCKNLELGHIHELKSLFTSPFFFIKKKDGSLCPIQDYQKLNEMTIKNRYPLPLISELIDKLQEAKYFTKLDVRWGYNNIQIKEGDEEKAAFHMNRGLFKPTIMFFGLTNSPTTFQWMMNDIFKDLISEGKVTIYLDNILIFTKDLDEHR